MNQTRPVIRTFNRMRFHIIRTPALARSFGPPGRPSPGVTASNQFGQEGSLSGPFGQGGAVQIRHLEIRPQVEIRFRSRRNNYSGKIW